MTQHQYKNLLITAHVNQTEAKSIFSYSIKNNARAPIYLFNLLYSSISSSGEILIEHTCYVEIMKNRVVLSKKIFPVPHGSLVEKPVLPLVTMLNHGETFAEEITLPGALVSANPYLNEMERPKTKHKLELPLFFEVGYFVAKPETHALAEKHKTNLGSRLGFDPFPITSQTIEQVGPIGMAVVNI